LIEVATLAHLAWSSHSYIGTEQWPTYLLWGLLLANNGYKHNDMEWNLIDNHFDLDDDDDDDDDDDELSYSFWK